MFAAAGTPRLSTALRSPARRRLAQLARQACSPPAAAGIAAGISTGGSTVFSAPAAAVSGPAGGQQLAGKVALITGAGGPGVTSGASFQCGQTRGIITLD